MHVAATGFDNTLGRAELGVTEFGVDDRIGSFEHEVGIDTSVHELHPCGILRRHVGPQGLLAAAVCLEHGVECKRIGRGKRKGAASRKVAPHHIAARNAFAGSVVTACENSGI